jgi:hypothetical protein
VLALAVPLRAKLPGQICITLQRLLLVLAGNYRDFVCVSSLNIMHITVVGCHWGPVILTSARIGSTGPERFPYSHCGWAPLRPSDSDFSHNWKHGTVVIPYSFQMIPRHLSGVWFTGNPHTTQPLINESNCTGEHVDRDLVWLELKPGILWSWEEHPNYDPGMNDPTTGPLSSQAPEISMLNQWVSSSYCGHSACSGWYEVRWWWLWYDWINPRTSELTGSRDLHAESVSFILLL